MTLIEGWHLQGRTIIAVMHEFARVRAHFPATLLLARRPIASGRHRIGLTDDNMAKALALA